VSLPKAAILTFTSRVLRAIPGGAMAPMLPYAALFEAEMLLGMRREREYIESQIRSQPRCLSSMTDGLAAIASRRTCA
jgi:hypothetical protein